MNKRHGLVLFLVIASGASCDDGGSAADPGPAPTDLRVDGNYQIVSTYDFTVGAVLPQPVATYAQDIVGLRTDPAGTMFKLLDDAGVPLASDLMDALPGPVADRLKGAINDFFAADVYGDARVSSELDALTAVIETVVARPDVVSQLSLAAPDATGATTATHRLEELRYHLDGGSVEITVPIVTPAGVPSSLLVVQTDATARVTHGIAGEDAHLQLGDHAFGVPYGDFVLAAVDQAMTQRYGIDLRGALGALVDCDGMAASVAGKCVLGACIGHQSTLASICDSGVDLAYQKLTERIRALRFDALRQSGQAQMWTDTAAGASERPIDRLTSGNWAASIDFGMGPRSVAATFTGTRATGP